MKKKALSLSDVSQKLIEGSVTDLNLDITLNLANLTLEDYQILLEVARYNSVGTKLLRTELLRDELISTSKQDLLVKVGSLINIGSYNQALTLIKSSADNKNENHELLLEKARIFVQLGSFRDALEILEPLRESSR